MRVIQLLFAVILFLWGWEVLLSQLLHLGQYQLHDPQVLSNFGGGLAFAVIAIGLGIYYFLKWRHSNKA